MSYNSPFLETVSLLPSLVSLLLCLSYTLSLVLLSFLFNIYFFSFSLSILKRCYTFASVNELAMTYQTTIAQQRNFDFFDFFSALYLVVSDILLTHTHTHTQLAFNLLYFLPSYARAKRAVTPVNKGLHGVSFVRFFVSICELSRKQNKNVLSTDFTTIIHCNSLINFVFTHQCFRQAAVRCCLPVERGKASG